MPFISQNFHHTMNSFTKVTAGLHDSTGALKTITIAYKEPSELFWNDLKSMLEDLAGLEIIFSERNVYEDNIKAPYFKIWDLEFSSMILSLSSVVSNYTLVPGIFRHYEYGPFEYSLKYFPLNSSDQTANLISKARINKNNTEYLELDYTIEIHYNTDFLVIDLRPYADKTLKFTICCLIKGTDINGKTVVYTSGGCNTYTDSHTTSGQWGTFHKLVWSESPKVNPYTGTTVFPLYSTKTITDRGTVSQNQIFIDLVNNNYTPHASNIQLNIENNIIFQKPICCWGKVVFSDNILTGPINLTIDTNYEINEETYYCPGDYVTALTMDSTLEYNRYAMRFLLKI